MSLLTFIIIALVVAFLSGAASMIVLSWALLLILGALWRPMVQNSLNQGPHYRPEPQ